MVSRSGEEFGGGFAAKLLVLAGCASPLQAPSAFSGEQNLCDEPGLMTLGERLAECRLAQPPCLGYVSFTGTIDGQAVTVDGPAVESTYHTSSLTVGQPPSGDVRWIVFSPYFRFSYDMLFALDPVTHALVGPDPANHDVLNVEARGGNYLSTMGRGTRDVRAATPTEFDASFSAPIDRGGSLEGCFHVFPTPF